MPHAAVTPFTASLKPSRLWLAWVAATHILLSIALLCLMPHWLWLMFAYPVTLWLSLAPNSWLPGKSFICQIQVDARGRLFVVTKTSAQPQQAQVLDDSFTSQWLIVLNLRLYGRRISAEILSDNAPAEFRRALRVYLRWFPLDEKPPKRSLFQSITQRT